jgi:hypothetical protein
MDMYPAHKANDDAEKSPFVIVGFVVVVISVMGLSMIHE